MYMTKHAFAVYVLKSRRPACAFSKPDSHLCYSLSETYGACS